MKTCTLINSFALSLILLTVKHAFNIEEYSFSQATLEQVC